MTDKENYPRILVVEDDDDQREMICETLRIHYGGSEAGNIVGVSCAAECLAEDLGAYDVILQDYNLPDMDGLKLMDEILGRADVPVLFVTGENVSAKAAEAIQHGAQDYVIKLGDYLFSIPALVDKAVRQHQIRRENQRLQRELQAMLSELRTKNVQLEESLEKVRMLATTDHLTGLSNRRRFSEILERYYNEANRYHFDLTCCMCDLDQYKQLNDTLGHQVGDEILVITAGVILDSMRSSDVAARYGGDEFVLLLPHTSVERGISVSERIRRELIRRTRNCRRLNGMVTMSFGVASLAADCPTSADALVAMADRAMYMAKDRGKDCIVAFNEICETADARS
ncbi:MAG: diguanylate cyclase [Planctomycetota bacterium]|nr:diguanylate cyclase [Planctomycetota bacterium]